jgi:hypothetical protein
MTLPLEHVCADLGEMNKCAVPTCGRKAKGYSLPDVDGHVCRVHFFEGVRFDNTFGVLDTDKPAWVYVCVGRVPSIGENSVVKFGATNTPVGLRLAQHDALAFDDIMLVAKRYFSDGEVAKQLEGYFQKSCEEHGVDLCSEDEEISSFDGDAKSFLLSEKSGPLFGHLEETLETRVLPWEDVPIESKTT